MRHLYGGFKLRRDPAHRRALLRNLATSLIEKERILTTVAKAKAVKPIVERMVTLGKKGTLADKRRALAFLFKRSAVTRLFNEVAPRFMDRSGGYTRIIRNGYRKGDGAELAFLEFVDYTYKPKAKKDKKKDLKNKRA